MHLIQCSECRDLFNSLGNFGVGEQEYGTQYGCPFPNAHQGGIQSYYLATSSKMANSFGVVSECFFPVLTQSIIKWVLMKL